MELASLPAAWQTKYNAAATGDTVSVTLKVVSDGESFSAYIDGDLATTYDHPEVLAPLTGMAYGARANSAEATIRFTVTQYYQVRYFDGDEDLGGELSTGAVRGALDDSAIAVDTIGAYLLRFRCWTDAAGREITTVTGNETLYAVRTRVYLHTVTYRPDNGSADIVQYYEDGATLALPTAPFKNGSTEGGTSVGYTFLGWYNGTDMVAAGTKVTSDMTLRAKYEESVAYRVSYVTNAAGVSVEDSIVTKGSTLRLPVVERSGYRFLRWYCDAALTRPYDEGAAVNESFTLYAGWVLQIRITYTANGSEVGSYTIDQGATMTPPAIPAKASETLTNGNVVKYTADGWYVGDTKITSAYAFSDDTEVTARYTAVETRSVFTVVKNADGYDGYSVGEGVSPTQGTFIPGVTLDAGEFSYTITYTKSSSNFEVRIAFYVDGKGNVSYTGGQKEGNQNSVWITQNLTRGGLAFGTKVEGKSGNTYNITYEQIKSCAYKNYFDSVAVGSEITLTLKVVFCHTAVKYYVNDCLMFTFGDADHSGETLYGRHFSETNYEGTSEQKAQLDRYLASPTGKGVGFQFLSGNTTTVGGFTISDITVREGAAISVDDGSGTTYTVVKVKGSTLSLSTPTKDNTYDGNKMTVYTFDGWYLGDVKLDASTLVDDLGGKKVVARFTETSVDCYTISFRSNGGSDCADVGWTSDMASMTLPTPTRDSHIFLGWYYDAALTQAVDASAMSLTSDITLYASWRLPYATGATKREDGTWVTSSEKTSAGKGQNSLIVDGILSDRCCTISADITFVKGNSSSVGIMLYGSVNADDTWEAKASYIAIQFKATSGEISISTVVNGTYRWRATAELKDLPAAWQTKYNAAATGDTVSATLKVVSDGATLSAYIDGDLATTYQDPDVLASLTGMAYGARANSAGATIKFTVSYNSDSNEEETV